MRELIAIEYVSVDGVMQAPGFDGEDREGGFERGGWTQPYMADHRRYNDELYPTAGAFLFGRKTYEIFLPYWPKVSDTNDLIARALNTQPKYVASRTLSAARWKDTTILSGDLRQQVSALKDEPGRRIFLVGSAELAQALMQLDLIDAYQLWVHPVVLGSGKRLFRDCGPSLAFELVDAKTTSLGVVIQTYRRVRK